MTDLNGTTKQVEATKNGGKTDQNDLREAGPFRTVLPQIVATSVKNLLIFDLGLTGSITTIILPALTGLTDDGYANETLRFTPAQASWFASTAFIFKPIGSAFSGWLTDPIGRKRAMIVVNIPHIIAWSLLHFAQSIHEMFLAAVLIGLGIGFMEAPIATYVGEICQPAIRGTLTAMAGVAATLGVLTVFLLGTVFDWRQVALICLFVPIFTMIALCFVPETPFWLLSKDRVSDALRSLRWLRGWVSEKAVSTEFEEMKRYSKHSTSCSGCQKAKLSHECAHPPPTIRERFCELLRKRNLKPFMLVLSLFCIAQISGFYGMRPYIQQIFQAYQTPISAKWGTVVIGLLSLTAHIILMFLIPVIGKRRMAFISLTGTILSISSLGFYAYATFPSGWSSFQRHAELTEFTTQNYIPMVLLFTLAFFANFGVFSIPWILLSEVFPFKTRGTAAGFAAAVNYLMGFVSTKTYFNLEQALGLHGVFWLYGFFGILGMIWIYFTLPETENRTLEDIEMHFSNNSLKFTDIEIKRNNFVKIDADNESGKKEDLVDGKRQEDGGYNNVGFQLNEKL